MASSVTLEQSRLDLPGATWTLRVAGASVPPGVPVDVAPGRHGARLVLAASHDALGDVEARIDVALDVPPDARVLIRPPLDDLWPCLRALMGGLA